MRLGPRQVMVSCSIPAEMADELRAIAHAEEHSLAHVLRRIIVAHFERRQPSYSTDEEFIAQARGTDAPTFGGATPDSAWLDDDVRPAARAVRPIG